MGSNAGVGDWGGSKHSNYAQRTGYILPALPPLSEIRVCEKVDTGSSSVFSEILTLNDSLGA